MTSLYYAPIYVSTDELMEMFSLLEQSVNQFKWGMLMSSNAYDILQSMMNFPDSWLRILQQERAGPHDIRKYFDNCFRP